MLVLNDAALMAFPSDLKSLVALAQSIWTLDVSIVAMLQHKLE